MNEPLKSILTPRVQGVYATADERHQARHPALADFDRMVGAAALRALQEHGCEPLNREVAAAHEAGHAVVALAIGHASRINRLIVKRAPRHESRLLGEAWLGRVYLPEGDYATFHAAAKAGNGWAIVREAAFSLAGMAGEHAIGREHLASSIEDRARAQVACQAVAALELGGRPFTTDGDGGDFDAWCKAHKDKLVELTHSIFVACCLSAMDVIKVNRRPFDRLRHKLMTHERLGWSEIAPLVDDMHPVTLGVL